MLKVPLLQTPGFFTRRFAHYNKSSRAAIPLTGGIMKKFCALSWPDHVDL